ncbi:MAG: hypothetical protein RR672_14060 [Raoultibacter sp.]
MMQHYTVNLHYAKRQTDPFMILEDFTNYIHDLAAAYDEFTFDPYDVVQSACYCCLSVNLRFPDRSEVLRTSDFAFFWRMGKVDSYELGLAI